MVRMSSSGNTSTEQAATGADSNPASNLIGGLATGTGATSNIHQSGLSAAIGGVQDSFIQESRLAVAPDRGSVPSEVLFPVSSGGGRTTASDDRKPAAKASSATKKKRKRDKATAAPLEEAAEESAASTPSKRTRKLLSKMKKLRRKLGRVDRDLVEKWERLLMERPETDDSENMSSWLDDVVATSGEFQNKAKRRQQSKEEGAGHRKQKKHKKHRR